MALTTFMFDRSKARWRRRLTVILSADVAGFSRLVGLDEEATVGELRSIRRHAIDPRIENRCGRIVKTTGDGLLVEFESPVEAVRCAVEIQQAINGLKTGVPADRQIEFRIGVNLGDIIAEGEDIHGDGVNIAARLQAMAQPGGLCISGPIHDQIRDRLPYAFDDMGEVCLKNIARPVRVFSMPPEKIVGLPPQDEPAPRRLPSLLPFALAATTACLVALTVGAIWDLRPSRPGSSASESRPLSAVPGTNPLPDSALRGDMDSTDVPNLSIVVLPFEELSGDPAQEYVAETITEDLTTDLSRIPGSVVIAHATAVAVKQRAQDLRGLGRDLGVRYALTGSVRRAGGKVGINAELIDVASGRSIWADRFEDDWSRLGDLQDEISGRLANSLNVQLTEAESRRIEREARANPDAVDLSMRGWASLNRPRTQEHIREALALFDSALARDPGLVPALVGRARSLTYLAWLKWSASPQADLAEADKSISAVLSLAPDHAMAHFVKGDILKARKQFEAALTEFEIAIANDPNLALAYEALGHTMILLGRPAEALDPIAKALRLSPHDPALNLWLFHMCHAYTHLGEDLEAIQWCRKSVAVSPIWLDYIDLASAYGWTGQIEQAREAVADLRKLMPGYTVRDWARADFSADPDFLAQYARIVEGLRKAGLPEG